MIRYEPDKWSVYFALSLRGSVLPKASVWALTCCLVAICGHQLTRHFSVSSYVHIEQEAISVFGGFNFILGFLVVFRSQQAYTRWWEGGTLLQQIRGEWFNAFSSLMAFCNTSQEKAPEVLEFQHSLVRLTSLLYASALKEATTVRGATFEVIDLEGFDMEHLTFLDRTHDRCEVVLQWMQRLIVEANMSETIVVAPPILSRVYNQLGNGIVNLSNARKISDFPIPFPLAQMLTFMLIINWFAIAIFCSVGIRRWYWAGMVSFVAEIAYWSVNYIAIELEMPFGDDPNDLPLQEMQQDLNDSLKGLLQPLALTPPAFNVSDRAMELHTTLMDLDRFVPTQSLNKREKDSIRGGNTKKPGRPKQAGDRSAGLPSAPGTSASSPGGLRLDLASPASSIIASTSAWSREAKHDSTPVCATEYNSLGQSGDLQGQGAEVRVDAGCIPPTHHPASSAQSQCVLKQSLQPPVMLSSRDSSSVTKKERVEPLPLVEPSGDHACTTRAAEIGGTQLLHVL